MNVPTIFTLTTLLLATTGCGRDKAALPTTEAHEAHESHGAANGASPKVPLKEIRGLRLMQVP